jgi:putative tricarboxylic transport membrane protein
MEPPSGAARAHWTPGIWVSTGLLANAALITTIGFILSCSLCYLLAVQGLRSASGQPLGQPRTLLVDLLTGMAISAPVFWTFTQFLAINLPGLSGTGWF